MAARSLECIARGEQILSIRTRQRVRRIFPRSSSHPEHAAHASDLPRCIPARRQLDWSVARASLIDALHLSVGPKLALGGPLGFGSAPGRFGYLRVALRTRLSGLFARFGRVSERCRVLDAECVCRSCADVPPRAPECVQERVPNGKIVRSDWAGCFLLSIPPRGTRGRRAWNTC